MPRPVRTTADEVRQVLLPVDLAEAELRAKPAAAVMVLLRSRGDGLEVLLGKRVDREGDPWSGQIGLPGGRHREGDGTLLETALREAREEVGLELRDHAEILGHMALRAPGNLLQLLVVPFVAFTREDLQPRVGPEMEATFWTPLQELPATWGRTTILTAFGDLSVPAYLWKGRVIWGFTYRVLEELLVLVGLSR